MHCSLPALQPLTLRLVTISIYRVLSNPNGLTEKGRIYAEKEYINRTCGSTGRLNIKYHAVLAFSDPILRNLGIFSHLSRIHINTKYQPYVSTSNPSIVKRVA